MNRKKQLILSSLLVLIILILIYASANGNESKGYAGIYIFNKNLPAGSIVGMSDILEIKVQSNQKLTADYALPENIEGKYIHSDVREGQAVITGDLYENAARTVFSDLKPGNVMYTISLKPQDANGWWLRPGNIIDILVFDNTAGRLEQSQNFISDNEKVTVIDEIKIIRVMDDDGNNVEDSKKAPGMLCLEVDYEKAKILFEAENSKKIKVVMGNN